MGLKLVNIKNCFFWSATGLLLLTLFHLESLSIGPVKVSHLWKGALLGVLLIKVASRGKIKSSVYNPLLLLAILGLFSLELIYNPMNAIFGFSTTVIIPLIGIYALGKDAAWCKKTLHFFAAFFILCFIPYEVGLLTPLGEGYDIATSYGLAAQGTIGPFQTVHSASTALAGALLVILYFLLTSAYSKVWLGFLFLLGFYLLLNTYVRTGIAMFAAGSLIMLGLFSIRSPRMFLRVSFLALAMVPLVSAFVFSNDALMARIMGERKHSSELDSFDTMGSGRGGMAIAGLGIYAEANFFEKAVGMGITEQKRRMREKIGKPLITHNGFLDILLHKGLVGFLLFLWFLIALWRSINRLKVLQSADFLYSLFIAYFVMTLFQEFDMLYMLTLMMLAYAWKHSMENKSR